MRILHVLSQRPEATGSGIYIRAMIAAATRRGHENFLLAGIPGGALPQLDEVAPERCCYVTFEGADLPFPVVGMSDVMPYPSRRFSDLTAAELDLYHQAFARRLDEAVSAFQPELIHSHHLWLLTALTRRRYPHIPLVTSCHSTGLRQYALCPHLGDAVGPACRDIDAVLALSQDQKRQIINVHAIDPRRIHVVGAGYDAGRFYAAPKPAADPVRILYAGKLSRTKGVAWLLRALQRVDSPGWTLELVGGGSGSEKEEVLALVETLGRQAIATGLVDQAVLAERLRQAHIFVLPSFFEGLPLVLLEALASGCRLVCTRLPGVVELLAGVPEDLISTVHLPPLAGIDTPQPGAAEAFQRELAAALVHQIKAAVEEPDPDLSPYASLLAGYTWEGVYERIDKVYRKAHSPNHTTVYIPSGTNGIPLVKTVK